MDVMIVGAGFIGKLHKRAWERNGANVAAVVDPRLPEQEKRALTETGTEVFERIGDAIRRFPSIGGASVCSPPKFHAEALSELLKNEIPVLMEKPVAASRRDYLRMMEETDRCGGQVMVGLTQRFYPEVIRSAAWIREGKIGKPLSVLDTMILDGSELPAWYYDLDISGGGILITNGVHLLDRIQYLLDGQLTVTNHYDGVYDAGGFDTIANISGVLNNGISYHMHAEWSQAQPKQETIIFGSEGRIELQSWQNARLYTSSGDHEEFSFYGAEDTFEEKTLCGLTAEVRTFIAGLEPTAGFPRGLSLSDHQLTMEVIWNCYQSAERGRRHENLG